MLTAWSAPVDRGSLTAASTRCCRLTLFSPANDSLTTTSVKLQPSPETMTSLSGSAALIRSWTSAISIRLAGRGRAGDGLLQHRLQLTLLGQLVDDVAAADQFSGDEQDKLIKFLSGGEKSRLVLALMLFDPPNFLVLDEPTNHLDLVTKQMLVETLKNFEGTMIFVSHDRTFLRGLANRVLDVSACPSGGAPVIYPGSYVEWVEKTGMEAPGVHA